MSEREYKLNIDPRILELLGPSLYTNIYYVLAELIANAYDADAHNVYIIANKDDITVEDDGKGMSYAGGDIQKYLNVAAVSRSSAEDSVTPLKSPYVTASSIYSVYHLFAPTSVNTDDESTSTSLTTVTGMTTSFPI